jgi:hypothetical protein
MRTLDLSLLPSHVTGQRTGGEFDFRKIVNDLQPAIQTMASGGLIEPNSSFGFAMAVPGLQESWQEHYQQIWDDPYSLIGLICGWGDEWTRYAANAVGKIRASARLGQNSLQIRLQHPDLFTDVVEPEGKGPIYPWGDFPHGGAIYVDVGKYRLLGAVSCLNQVEDQGVAALLLSLIGLKMLQLDAAA